MITLNYCEVGKEWAKYAEHAREAIRNYALKSGIPETDVNPSVTFQLAHLMTVFGSRDLKDKTILDLGCGSSTTSDGRGEFQPRLCRVLGYLGAVPIGIDIADSKERDFIFQKASLFDQDSLNIINGRIIVDAAHSYGLVDSPQVVHRVTGSEDELVAKLSSQIEGIVEPDGFFLWGALSDLGNEERRRAA